MGHVRIGATVVLGLGLLAQGCFYLDPVNSAPVAEIRQETLEVFVGTTVTFSGERSRDPDGEYLTYEWQWSLCESEERCAVPTLASAAPTYGHYVGVARGLYRIGLRVADPLGAHDEVFLFVRVQNRAPGAVALQVRDAANEGAPFTLGQTLAAIAVASDPDGDPLTWTWELGAPEGSQPAGRDWGIVSSDGNREEYLLRPDVAGEWRVRVSVSDGAADARDEVVFAVEPDAPPCIASTTPPAGADRVYVVERSAGAPRRFSVDAVTDDLDAYPPVAGADRGTASFRWFVTDPASGGALAAVPGRDLNDLVVDPAAHAPGERLQLRVEVADRTGVWPSCAEDQASCSRQGNACVQRMSWTVEVR